MKRKTALLLSLFLGMMTLFAVPSQKVLPIGSPVYSKIDLLYLSAGKAAPAGARPWTEEQAYYIVERINPSGKFAYSLRDSLLMGLSTEKSMLEGVVKFNAVAGFHSNEGFDNDKYWVDDALDARFFNLGGRFLLDSCFSAELNLGVGYVPSGRAYRIAADNSVSVDSEQNWRYNQNISSNLYPGFFDLTLSGRSTMALGNKYVGLLAGRDKLSWGNGYMGNLVLSDNLPYYDFVRFTIGNSDWFRYDSQVIFFNHPMNYDKYHVDKNTGLNFFLGNRLEFRFLDDRVRLTLNEAIMYQSRDNYLDSRLFNPLQIMHGLYISNHANSLASAELEIGLARNWQVYGSCVVDDLAVPGEPQPPNDKGSTPNSYGIMGGVRNASVIGNGFLTTVFEGSYIAPLTYHRRTGDYKIGEVGAYNDHSLDYIGSVRYFSDNRIYYQRRYLSMPFGSDSLAFTGVARYEIPSKFTGELHLFLMAHGITNEDSEIYLFDGTAHDWGWLLTKNPFDGKSGYISRTYNVGGSFDYAISGHWTLHLALDFIAVEHFKNLEDNAFDFQMTLGMRYSL